MIPPLTHYPNPPINLLPPTPHPPLTSPFQILTTHTATNKSLLLSSPSPSISNALTLSPPAVLYTNILATSSPVSPSTILSFLTFNAAHDCLCRNTALLCLLPEEIWICARVWEEVRA
ncbi:hypothetical protein K440DRAFT_613944 [Wilcoxina mikolae CBS 423.85]|nr:hypothetical protein K440DRAFT_613944 [Wilcoxina mikolae CBS 423.85]